MLILPHMAQKSNFYDLHGDFISIWRRYAEMHKKPQLRQFYGGEWEIRTPAAGLPTLAI